MVEPSGRCDVSLEPLTTHGQFYIFENGGAKRDRTADLLRARQALSQLSYGPIVYVYYFTNFCETRQNATTYSLLYEEHFNAVSQEFGGSGQT